jgi:hypothetical protein
VKGDKTTLVEKEPDKIYSLGASLPLIDMSEAMQVMYVLCFGFSESVSSHRLGKRLPIILRQ